MLLLSVILRCSKGRSITSVTNEIWVTGLQSVLLQVTLLFLSLSVPMREKVIIASAKLSCNAVLFSRGDDPEFARIWRLV